MSHTDSFIFYDVLFTTPKTSRGKTSTDRMFAPNTPTLLVFPLYILYGVYMEIKVQSEMLTKR